MALSTSGKNKAADGAAAVSGYVSLHSGDPGSSGASELTGGSPAYARKAVTWTAAGGSPGVAPIAAGVTFDVPAGSTIGWVGMWSALTGGTFQGYAALSSSETYGGQGTYALTALSITVA